MLGFNLAGDYTLALTVTLDQCRDYLQEVHDTQQTPPRCKASRISDEELVNVLLTARRDIEVDTREEFKARIAEALSAHFP